MQKSVLRTAIKEVLEEHDIEDKSLTDDLVNKVAEVAPDDVDNDEEDEEEEDEDEDGDEG